MDTHLQAAKGAYIIKDYESNKTKDGIVIVRGTSSTNSIVNILPQLKLEGPNVKIIAAISWELFRRQSSEYRRSIIMDNEWSNCMIITNGAKKSMHKWIANRVVESYSLSPDFDNRWRTGGSLDQIIKESQLDPDSIMNGIRRFVGDREKRLNMLKI